LKTGRLTGVLRWKVVLVDETVRQECAAAGWRSAVLNTQGAKTLDEFLQISVTELGLPIEAQSSISAWEQALTSQFVDDIPVCITWLGWPDLIASSPADATVVVGIFEDILKEHPGLVLISGPQGNFPQVDELALA
jgi:hypothetical protein